jgi:hypothetical protein
MIRRPLLPIAALLAALAVLAPAALAEDGHITHSELTKRHKEKSQLVSSTFDYVSSVHANSDACVLIKSGGDQREISAFKRTMKKAAESAQDDSKNWVPLQKWGQDVEDRARSYDDNDDRRAVREAGGDIDIGASAGQSSLEQVARISGVLAKLNCNPPDSEKPSDLLDRASKRLGNAFDALDRVVR